MVMSTRVFRALQSNAKLATQLVNGGAHPAGDRGGGPELHLRCRPARHRPVRPPRAGQRAATKVLPDNQLLLLPAPVDPNDEGAPSSAAPSGVARCPRPSPAGASRRPTSPASSRACTGNAKPPMGIEVISDAIGLPVLANADLSIAATVL
jgi:hypothetical protein